MARAKTVTREVHGPSTGKERDERINSATAEITKRFGQGSIMRFGDEGPSLEIEAIPTGSIALDAALGIGGVPRGRIVEIYGPESSGKTTLSLEILAEAQAMGGVVAFIDAEHALDPGYAARIGVDIDDVLISQPDTGEQALEICDMLVRSGAIDVIVIDSVAALTPRAEIEGEIGETTVGLQARLMSQALRKLAGSLSKSNTTCIFINQLREKIGVMFGSPETTPGGRALKFFSSVRLDIRRIDTLKNEGNVVGNRVRVKVVKNKVAPPFQQAEFDIMYGTGISKEGSALDMAVDFDIVDKSGAWYTYEGERLGQGREAAKEFLQQHPDLLEEIEHQVRIACGLEFEDEEAGAPAASASGSAAGAFATIGDAASAAVSSALSAAATKASSAAFQKAAEDIVKATGSIDKLSSALTKSATSSKQPVAEPETISAKPVTKKKAVATK